MDKEQIQNLIKKLIEKTTVKLNEISITEDGPKNMWVSVTVGEPHFFVSSDGEGLHALNHLVHRIIESKMPKNKKKEDISLSDASAQSGLGIIIDINGFQKKRVENIRAIAHMMSERARYFKSNIEIDPMSAFERRIVHEFLSNATDLKTESTGMGHTRRVVIKYIGNL
ncbi:MAG: R3H domain protein [Candidatus Nomurabacteria bacterium GW2011_GWA1_37_20]|uniref:R3H domain protein n=2 Tax=Parcubacteria group TaxID=1794811 RepID=A0A0G0HX81_9BACT|nr:MAG: R3H domain protein [Parcubacteria group bacterium GW2011_GWB1_37_13]KKQ33854.1 MAG: R3H domain protein [Candidatus Nomurabacteria bacterium GW2011_GWA1_37_20]KKQ47728.1 MAG: R3H domain protein [Candidatus Yanofskybacteria bacterium GW2011_GWC2_37_9]